MKNHLRNALLIMLCFATILGTPLVQAAHLESSSPTTMPEETESPVDSIIEAYMNLRQNSVVSAIDGGMTAASRNATMSRLSSQATQEVLKKEEGRRRGHAAAAKNAGIVVLEARTEVTQRTVEPGKDAIRVHLYETTTCDYRHIGYLDEDYLDTFWFGLWHDMLFANVDGQWTLVQDDYDEPDIVDPDGTPARDPADEPILVVPTFDTVGIMAASPDPYRVASYADKYVYEYNKDEYRTMSADCANFVSQCLFDADEGGGLSPTSNWWYNANGTPSGNTGDDSWSESWVFVPTQVTEFAKMGTFIPRCSNADVNMGQPVWQDRHQDGSYNHAIICVGRDEKGVPITNSHNSNWYHKPITYSDVPVYCATVKFVPPVVPITVTSPNGGESWRYSTLHTIVWNPGSIGGNVRIDYSISGGSYWSTLVSSTSNDGYYDWLVNVPATTQAKIRITSLTDATFTDQSDYVFSITDASR